MLSWWRSHDIGRPPAIERRVIQEFVSVKEVIWPASRSGGCEQAITSAEEHAQFGHLAQPVEQIGDALAYSVTALFVDHRQLAPLGAQRLALDSSLVFGRSAAEFSPLWPGVLTGRAVSLEEFPGSHVSTESDPPVSSILVVTAPPLVGRGLRPSGR